MRQVRSFVGLQARLSTVYSPECASTCRMSVSRTLSTAQAPASSFTQGSYTDDTADPHIPSGNQKTALLKRMLRANLLSETAAARLAAGQNCCSNQRPDLALRQEREAELLRRVQELAPGYRVRPSLLQPLSSAIGFSLGAVAGILPREASGAITGAVQEALTEQYNDQLRELRESGLSEESVALREALRELRDEERAPEDAVRSPDVLKLQRPQDLTPSEALAGLVKFGFKGLLTAGSIL